MLIFREFKFHFIICDVDLFLRKLQLMLLAGWFLKNARNVCNVPRSRSEGAPFPLMIFNRIADHLATLSLVAECRLLVEGVVVIWLEPLNETGEAFFPITSAGIIFAFFAGCNDVTIKLNAGRTRNFAGLIPSLTLDGITSFKASFTRERIFAMHLVAATLFGADFISSWFWIFSGDLNSTLNSIYECCLLFYEIRDDFFNL